MRLAEQNVQIADRLYECRRAARSLLGANYTATLQPWRDLIDLAKVAKGLTTLQAAIDLSGHLDPAVDEGMALMLIFAAAVETLEATT